MNKRQAKKNAKKKREMAIKAMREFSNIDWSEIFRNLYNAFNKAIEIINQTPELLQKLKENANEEEQET